MAACETLNHYFSPVCSILLCHLPYVAQSKRHTYTVSMSQEVIAQSNTVQVQLSVHRSLSDTAKALKETRIDGPFPPKILLRLQKSLGFVFKRCEGHQSHGRQRSLQQKLGFAGIIVCCMSFGLGSMLITEFDFMITYADIFVRDQDLKRRLYHPEVEEQLRKSEHDFEHQASREQFLKG